MEIILHFDMDYFFAQIEERENPQFKGKPLVVGADPKRGRGRGVVATCNYEARKYGIKSGMPISKAYQLCPNAIFLPVKMEFYKKVSEEIIEIIKKYSPVYEIVSLDEGYLDLTNIAKNFEEAKKIGKLIKKEILEKERLTCTIGIGPNKLIAKLATEKAKPNGLKVILLEEVEKFLDCLEIEDLPGIGPKTAQKLRAIGIKNLRELKKLPKTKLKEMFGKMGEKIYERARGIDKERVEPKKIVKSISCQITFEKDTKDPGLIFDTFEKILKKAYQELIQKQFLFKTITVIFRDHKFQTKTKSKSFKNPQNDFQLLKREAKKLLLKFLLNTKRLVRLIGLRLKVC